ncbi:MAG: O-antigen ligase family protein [Sideroxyarcus sp.]|nr:O-antigen ligase family protein [Sideroxyarcus sp.]
MGIDLRNMTASIYPAGRQAVQVVVLLLALSIPVSTALDNVLLFLLLLGAGMSGYLPEYWRCVRQHPVARGSTVLFIALLLGCSYGATAYGDAFGMLGKYVDLAFVPLLMVIFADEKLRQRVWKIFLAVMVVTALLSWSVNLEILSPASWMWQGTRTSLANPAIFRSSITQNILMSFATYILVLHAYWASNMKMRVGYLGLAILTTSSVLVLVQGRSGYLVLLLTLSWFGLSTMRSMGGRFTSRHLWVSLLAIPLLLWGLYETVPRLHQRVDETVTEFQSWYPHSGQATSIGERLEFYFNTGSIVSAHPAFGVGTGGFASAYAQQTKELGVSLTVNPHNEYLHLTVQLGVLGAALFMYLLYTQWRTAFQLKDIQSRDTAIGLMLTLMVTSLVNTPLMDHTEGLFFAYMSALCFASLKQKEQNE